MGSRTNADRLKQLPSRTGRLIGEDGESINEANVSINEIYSKAVGMSVAGRCFFTADTQEVASLDTITYTIQTPVDKYLLQYARDLKVSANLWDIESSSGGTITGGTPLIIRNTILDEPIDGTIFTYNATITGDTITATDFISAPGLNKAGGLSESAGGTVVMYPPGSTFSLRITNTGNAAAKIRIDYVFAEITNEEKERLKGIYVI